MRSKFWLDSLAENVHEKFPNEKILHLSCGLSIRGPQHIGRIRGELCIPSAIKRILEEKFGRKAIHYLILYDLDSIKPKALKIGFRDEKKQEKYDGVSIINIEDPFSCHENWVEHFWEDFGGFLKEFGFEVEIKRTSDFYKIKETKELVKWILENREIVVKTVNRFRGRKPWPEDYIPLNPICENCLSIAHTTSKSFDLKRYTVCYVCEKCKNEGETKIENGKLNWRLEWPALWKVFHVEFEPYGKDHAAAGGSRETCSAFSKELFNYEAPLGEWYEWVGLKMHSKYIGEMTASGFVGITPKQWIEIAQPEILRFLFISTRPHTTITIDLDNFCTYFENFDRAERIYFGIEEERNERERKNLIRSYELASIKAKKKFLPQIPFDFCSLVAQVARIDESIENISRAIEILKRTKHLPGKISEEDENYVKERLIKAMNWIKLYAPEKFKLKIAEEIKEEIREKIDEKRRKALHEFAKFLKTERKEKEIVEKFLEIAENFGIAKEELFKAAYLALLGKEYGPRLAPLIKALGEEKVSSLFEKV